MLCLKANLLRAKALLPKVLLQKAALLDWSAPGLRLPEVHYRVYIMGGSPSDVGEEPFDVGEATEGVRG